MNEVQIFNNEEFGKLDVINVDGSPWFVGKQVAEILGIKDPSNHLSRDVKEKHRATLTFGGEIKNLQAGGFNGTVDITSLTVPRRGLTIINESGLYELVLHSKLSSAERFQDWITEDVLPSIRKHGAYMTTDTMARVISDPDFAIGLLQALKAEQEKSKDLEARIEREKPMTELGKAITSAEENISIGDMAKILRQNGAHVGRTRLFEKLRDDNLLQKSKNEWNIPTQKAMESGLFHIKETTWTNPATGFRSITKTTEITPKGQSYFIAKYTA